MNNDEFKPKIQDQEIEEICGVLSMSTGDENNDSI